MPKPMSKPISKPKKKQASLSTNAWMATYTDLMILLLTFFVLLLSMATIDQRRKRLAINSFVGAFGFMPGAQSILGKPKGMNITVGSAPLMEEDVKFEKLRNVALKHELESDLSVMKQHERTIISINNRVLFDPGSHEIKTSSHEFLFDLAQVIKEGARTIELRGYTEQVETIFKQDQLKYSMFLSTKRAFAVFNFFRENCDIPVEKIIAHGFGDNLKDKGKKADEGMNRQVEIIIDEREKIPYKYRLPKKKDSLLDFKGFFFRTPVDVYEK